MASEESSSAPPLSPSSSPSLFSQIGSISSSCIIPKLPFSPENQQSSQLREHFSRLDDHTEGHVNTSKRTESLKKIISLLKTIPILTSFVENENNINIQHHSKELALLIIFLGEQHDGTKEWSCSENASLVSEVIQEIIIHFGIETHNSSKTTGERLQRFFVEDFKNAVTARKSIFLQILKLLKPKLKTDEWRYRPFSVSSFAWILTQIKYPYLSDFVDEVLPPLLLFSDDYLDSNKLVGIQCIAYCIENVNKAELQRNNWGMVLYDAVHKLIHEKDPQVITSVASTLLQILNLVEINPNQNSDKMTKYDDTMKKIIFTMELSSDNKQKKVWMPHLITLIQTMGHATLHWADRISSMLLDFTRCTDPQLWLEVLRCVEVCIQNTWLKPDSTGLVEIILRIIFNLSILTNETDDGGTGTRQAIYEKIQDCFELLSKCEDFSNTRSQLLEILDSKEKLHSKFIYELEKLNLIQ